MLNRINRGTTDADLVRVLEETAILYGRPCQAVERAERLEAMAEARALLLERLAYLRGTVPALRIPPNDGISRFGGLTYHQWYSQMTSLLHARWADMSRLNATPESVMMDAWRAGTTPEEWEQTMDPKREV